MTNNSLFRLRYWLKHSDNIWAKRIFIAAKTLRTQDLRYPDLINRTLYALYLCLRNSSQFLLRVIIETPAFRGRCHQSGHSLYLFGGIPYIAGPLSITIGDRCRISGQTTFSASGHSPTPSLSIGNNVGIGWQTSIAVGTQVVLEDNVRIAGRACLFGYSGHPLDAALRAQGHGDDPSQIGDIILKKDCWLATNVIVHAGVTIGEGAVIAAGSVVTRDIPPFVLAGGVPAKVIRPLPVNDPESSPLQQGERYA